MKEGNKIQSPENEIVCIGSFQQESQLFLWFFRKYCFSKQFQGDIS